MSGSDIADRLEKAYNNERRTRMRKLAPLSDPTRNALFASIEVAVSGEIDGQKIAVAVDTALRSQNLNILEYSRVLVWMPTIFDAICVDRGISATAIAQFNNLGGRG